MKRTAVSKIDTGRGAGRLAPLSTRPAASSAGVKASATSTKIVPAEGSRPGSAVVFNSPPVATSTPIEGIKRSTPKDLKASPFKRINSGNPPAAAKDAVATTKNGVPAKPARKLWANTKPSSGGVTLLRGNQRSANGSGSPRKMLTRKALSNQEVNQLAETAVKASAFLQRNPNTDDGQGGAQNSETGFLPSRSVDSLTKVTKKSAAVVSPNVASVECVAICTQTDDDESERWQSNLSRFRLHELESDLQDTVKELVAAQVELQHLRNQKEAGGFPGSPIATESKSTSFSLSPGEVRESLRDLAFCRHPVDFSVFDKDTELEEKLKELEEKYQEQMTDNLKLKAEIEAKDKELNIWKDKHAELQNKLAIEKSKVEKEMIALAQQQKDMLLVVQAAESYRLDSQIEVTMGQKEISSLKDKINALESKLKNMPSNSVRKQGVGIQVLLEDNKINKRDGCDPKDNDNGATILPLPSSKSFSSHDGSDKENRSSNEETESETRASNVTTNIMRTLSTFGNSKIGELGSSGEQDEDPLNTLVPFVKVSGGSKRNALLRWCQSRTINYKFVDITNFSTSWSDGMALCALLHSYIPEKIQYDILSPENSRHNFEIAMSAADSLSIPPTLNIDDIVNNERPSWENVMNYVKEIYLKLASCDSNPIPM